MAYLDDGRTGKWNMVRKRILKRDGHSCVVCGARATDVDHILPRTLGGADTYGNLQSLCRRHHKIKSAADHKRIRALAMQALAQGPVVNHSGGGGDQSPPQVQHSESSGGGAQVGADLKRGGKRGGPFGPYPSPPALSEGSEPDTGNSSQSRDGAVIGSPFQ